MNNIEQIAQFFNDSEIFKGKVKKSEPLSSHTTMHVGGKAEIFIEPETTESLFFAVKNIKAFNLDFFILGGGSNVIISDKGLPVVISTRKINQIELIDKISLENNTSFSSSHMSYIQVDSGASWGKVISFCKENDLAGFEEFTGLSGSVGGALYMNATCFGLNACDNLIYLSYLDCDKMEIFTCKKKDSDWAYKKSPFQTGSLKNKFPPLILSAVFSLKKGFDQLKSQNCILQRQEKGHFKAPSSGSAFKNDSENGIIAGKIIDECGLKGFSVGGAQIAPWHGNFIINPEQKASAEDIKNLSDRVKEIVFEKKGINLENEILFIGE